MHPQGTFEPVSIHHATQRGLVTAAKAVASGIWIPLLHALQDWRGQQAARVMREYRHLIQDERCVDCLGGSNAVKTRQPALKE